MSVQLSIVIPTHDRYAAAARAVTALCDQIVRDGFASAVEVLLVDDGSPPACVTAVRDFLRRQNRPFVRYIELPAQRGAAAARNAGIVASRGSLVAFLDDDLVAGDDYVRAVIRAHVEHPDALVINGNLRPLNDGVYAGFWFHQYDAVFNRPNEDFYPVEMLAAGNFSVKRSLLARETPLFDTSLTSREDFDLYLRLTKLGIASYKDDSILVFLESRGTLLGFLRQYLWYDRGQEQLVAKHGEALLRTHAPRVAPKWRYVHLYLLLRVGRRAARASRKVRRRFAGEAA